MTLEDFLTRLNKQINYVAADYYESHKTDPESYPLELSEDEWQNYFIEQIEWTWDQVK